MSKLIEKLRKTTRTAPRRLGFGAISAEMTLTSPLILVAELESLDNARAAAKAGADAIYWQTGPTAGLAAVAACAKETELPVGLALSAVSPNGWTELDENNCDFVTVELDSRARALDLQPVDVVLMIPLDTDDLLLRTIEQLPVDALVIADGLGSPADLTVQRLMSYQRLALLARRPLILHVDAELEPSELGLLRDVGIQALAVRADSEESRKTLGALRQALKSVPPRRRKREEHLDAFVPAPPSPAHPEPEEPDEAPFPPE